MSQFLFLGGVLLLLAAALWDLRERRIPNFLSVGLAVLGLIRLAILLASGDASPHLAVLLDIVVTASLFFVGIGLFSAGLLGGGDVKLLAAAALWIGWTRLPELLVVTSLAGGALALVFLAARAFAHDGAGSANAERLPYGVAIAAGGMVAASNLFV